jgi:lipopolysaccharide assembly protein A
MRYLTWFLRIVLFVLLLGFTVRNVETVTLHYYFGYEWQAPLVLIILLFFALGVVIGVLSCLGKIFTQRRKIATFRKKYPITNEEPE